MQSFFRKREVFSYSVADGSLPNPKDFVREIPPIKGELFSKQYILPDGSRHGTQTIFFNGQRGDKPVLKIDHEFGRAHGPVSFSSSKEGNFSGQYKDGLPHGVFNFGKVFIVFDSGLPVVVKYGKNEERLEWDPKNRSLLFRGRKYFNVRATGQSCFANDYFGAESVSFAEYPNGLRFFMRWCPYIVAETTENGRINGVHLAMPIFF
nr:MORN repeat containing protein [Marseillevirus futianmevirus]